MIRIEESGIEFGPFDKDDFFAIEEALQQKKLSSKGVCSVEFVVKNNNSLIFLEAKTSIPKDSNKFFTEITEKFEHSLIVFVNALLKRNDLQNDLPANFTVNDSSLQSIKLLLVIKSAPSDYLQQLTDKLRKSLKGVSVLWSIKPQNIQLINEERAIKLKLTKLN